MSDENGKPAKTLANLPLGPVATALGPLAIVVWQGMAWATEIEANVKANQAQIEILIEQVRANDESDEENQREILDAIGAVADRIDDEADSTRAEPVD